MIFFREINPLSAKLLKRIYCQSKKFQVRQRAHCLILANQGTKVENLRQIFPVSSKTIYNWFERWESEGMVGLYNQPVRGRKPTFNPQQKAKIKEWTRQEPRQLKQVLEKVEEEWGIKSSKKTLPRVLETLKMS